ncbi:MAG: hypothetical protein OEY51_04880 [Cyclobacteriaceae bacterium]|nr:hypothetical protein [Cyclobacteriaceae bacterium]
MKPDLTIIKIACFLFTLALPMTVAEGLNFTFSFSPHIYPVGALETRSNYSVYNVW